MGDNRSIVPYIDDSPGGLEKTNGIARRGAGVPRISIGAIIGARIELLA
jgi:hypothetical protein